MIVVLRDEVVRARKSYACDACWIWNDRAVDDVTADERLIIQAVQADKWSIKPGDLYRKTIYLDGGLRTYRARLDMDKLCLRYDLYDE